MTPTLPDETCDRLARTALHEDLGDRGDVTSRSIIDPDATVRAVIRARDAGILAGTPLARATFRAAAGDRIVRLDVCGREGRPVKPGDDVLTVEGCAHAILAAERTALNFMGRLSGVATRTSMFVRATAHTGVRICDTRKTTPGLRVAEKYAVRIGGGYNHRFGLHDAILIKDNHVAAAGGVGPALAKARAAAGHMMRIEIEVDSLEGLDDALNAGARVVLLDNMDPATLAAAVTRTGGRAVLEASGRISPDSAVAVAESGVDLISIGSLTHSAACVDFGLDVVSERPNASPHADP